MTRTVKRALYALLALFGPTAMAESADQGIQSSCSGYSVHAVAGMSAGQPVDEINPRRNVGRPTGAPAPSDCRGTNLDTLLGAPRDYEDRYGSSTNSVLDGNLMDPDASSPAPLASRPAPAIKRSQSIRSTIANSGSNRFAAPAVSPDVYRSPW
jgi:hypothetical protein